jgi:hypothetical protein
MHIRKIAAAAGFACGAALAFAPLAAAAPVDPTLVTDTLGSEVSSLNGLFQFDALLAGVPSTDYLPNGVHGIDTIIPADIAKDAPVSGTPSILDYELYGVNPFAAGVSGDSSAGNELNGALLAFYDAYNVEAYSAADGGTLDTNINDYLYSGFTQTVLGTANETTSQAFAQLYDRGIGDLGGYFQTNLSFLDIPTGTTAPTDPLASTVAIEVASLNSLFQTDAALAGVPSTDYSLGAQGFDVIKSGDISVVEGNGTTPFDQLVYGFNPANLTGDPGAYDVLNGAVAKFDDAFNIGLYALENGGANLPLADFATDLFGISGATATTLAGETASQAITTLLADSFNDFLGYF